MRILAALLVTFLLFASLGVGAVQPAEPHLAEVVFYVS
jgi:hypothetical protein